MVDTKFGVTGLALDAPGENWTVGYGWLLARIREFPSRASDQLGQRRQTPFKYRSNEV